MAFRVSGSSAVAPRHHLKVLSENNAHWYYAFKLGQHMIEVVTYFVGPSIENLTGSEVDDLVIHVSSNPRASTDRWARVEVCDQGLNISTDLYGSVPVYVNLAGRQISNVFPSVHSAKYLDHRGLLDSLVLGHPLWSRTVWEGVESLPPDSEVTFSVAKGSWTKVGHRVSDSLVSDQALH